MAYRIMEISKSFDDDVFYRASCMCGSKNCDMVLELEYIKDLDEIVLNIYIKMFIGVIMVLIIQYLKKYGVE